MLTLVFAVDERDCRDFCEVWDSAAQPADVDHHIADACKLHRLIKRGCDDYIRRIGQGSNSPRGLVKYPRFSQNRGLPFRSLPCLICEFGEAEKRGWTSPRRTTKGTKVAPWLQWLAREQCWAAGRADTSGGALGSFYSNWCRIGRLAVYQLFRSRAVPQILAHRLVRRGASVFAGESRAQRPRLGRFRAVLAQHHSALLLYS